MFCHKCGMKILPKTSVCPSCGRPVDANECCGGFWDLFEKPAIDPRQYPVRNSESDAAKNSSPRIENQVTRKSSIPKPQRKILIASILFMIILLLTTVIQSVRLHAANRENSRMEEEIEELKISLEDAMESGAEDTEEGVAEDTAPGSIDDTAEENTSESAEENTGESAESGVMESTEEPLPDTKGDEMFNNPERPEFGGKFP